MRESLIDVRQHLSMEKKKLYVIIGIFFVIILSLVAYSFSSNKHMAGNDQCPSNRAYVGRKCVDPCVGLCGSNTTCHVINHVPICSCNAGYMGHPITGCMPSPTPVSNLTKSCSQHIHCPGLELCVSGRCKEPDYPWRRSTCSSSDECDSSKACISGKCNDPCENICGFNTTCEVHNHVPACACKEGHTGDPFYGCSPMHQGNDQCEPNRVYNGHECVDPCVDLCGPNTVCHVINHVPICSCYAGYMGQPVNGCTRSPTRISEDCMHTPSGKKRFYLENERLANWHEALVLCQYNNSRLVSVESMEELQEINRLIDESGVRQGRYWTSGSDVDHEGHFLWTSLGKNISMGTGLWRTGEPNNYDELNEDCVELLEKPPSEGYYLNDVPCTYEFRYICEYYEE